MSRFAAILFAGSVGQNPAPPAPPTAIVAEILRNPVPVGTGAGTNIVKFTLIGGRGSGDWSVITGAALYEASTPDGKSVFARLKRQIIALDAGPETVRVQYLEPGMTAPLNSEVIPITVAAVQTVPTDILQAPDDPVTISTDAAVNQTVCTLTLVDGTGGGNWSIVGGNTAGKFKLSATTGQTIDVQVAAALGVAAVYDLQIAYAGDGLATALAESMTIIAAAPVAGGPTDITIGAVNDIPQGNSVPYAIAVCSLIGGNATGAWSIDTTTYSKVGLSSNGGRQVVLRATVAALVGDAGAKTTVVKYTEGATTLTETISYSVVSSAAISITQEVAAPVGTVGDAVGKVLTGLDLVGGNATGTWSITGGTATARLELSALGPGVRSPDLRTKTAWASGDVATGKTCIVSYTGEGPTLNRTITFDVAAGGVTQPAISASDNDVTLVNNAASGVDLAVITLTNGDASGTWTLTKSPTTAPFQLSAGANARQKKLETSRLLTPSDNGSYTLTVKYAETGFTQVQTVVACSVAAAQSRGVTWLSGFAFEGDGDPTSKRDQAETWLKRPVTYQTLFTGSHKGKWADAVSGPETPDGTTPAKDGGWQCIRANARDGVFTNISLPVNEEYRKGAQVGTYWETDFSYVNNGSIDSVITNCMQRIKAACTIGTDVRDELVGIRIGWEWDLGDITKGRGSFPWYPGANQQLNFRAAWRRIAGLAKAVMPNCKMVFCTQKDYGSGKHGMPINKHSSTDAHDWTWTPYPGHDVVDILTIDAYDTPGAAIATPAALASGTLGAINTLYDFAKAGGRKFGIDEWGLRQKQTWEVNASFPAGHWVSFGGGADNEYFIAGMYNWIKGKIADGSNTFHCESYFRPDAMFSYLDKDGAVHALWWVEAGTYRYNTPFNGRSDGVVSGVCSSSEGVCVGQAYVNQTGNCKATGKASAKYQALFGEAS